MNKVVVPKYVAEVIENLQGWGFGSYKCFKTIKDAIHNPNLVKVKVWAFHQGGGSPDKLMEAIVNGCEIEKSPEEKLREFYESNVTASMYFDSDSFHFSKGIDLGVKTTLLTYGITIEGINGEDD